MPQQKPQPKQEVIEQPLVQEPISFKLDTSKPSVQSKKGISFKVRPQEIREMNFKT